MEQGSQKLAVTRIQEQSPEKSEDMLAVEEPLEIRLGWQEAGKAKHRRLTVTMRTPGSDAELAVGLLFAEGIVQQAAQIRQVKACGRPAKDTGLRNVVRVDLCPDVLLDWSRLERHGYASSSCGLCEKTSLEAVTGPGCKPITATDFTVSATLIHTLPDVLRKAQAVFETTGGLHAAALFDAKGTLLGLREDVGRHNAVDKLIGAELLADRLPLSDRILFVSGRAGFELVQKAVQAGVPVMAAVGAPSSLAVALAVQSGLTLLGFVRNRRFNIYSAPERITTEE